MYVHSSLVHHELYVYRHLAGRMTGSPHQERINIRKLLDSFQISRTHGKHIVLVSEVAQLSLRDLRLVFRKGGFEEGFVRATIIRLLKALDLLHAHGEVAHTGISRLFYCHALTLLIYRYRYTPGKHAFGHR